MLEMTRDEKYGFVAGLVSLAVYVVVAWLAANFFDVSMWRALAVLLVARTFFGIVEGAAGVLNWRLWGRRTMVRGFVEVLRSNNFPPRFNRRGDFLNYLHRVQDGHYPEPLKRAAREFYQLLATIESQGMLAGMRAHAASELALEAYSPKANAPLE